MTRVEGIIPILSMPFRDDDAIDIEALVGQADFLIETGVDGVGFGFGSEIFRLTDAEREAALRETARTVAGRVPIIVASGANSTRATIERSLALKEAGADVLMVTPPAFAAVGPDAVIRHYTALAEAVGLPIIVQDAPGMTGVTMADDLLARLASEMPCVVAIKVETIPPAPKVGAVAARVGATAAVLGGAGGLDFVHELGRGAVGTIPGAALPELFVFVWRAFREGRVAEARACFNRFLPLLALTGRTMDVFLWSQKEILRRRGVLPSARMRAPAEPIDPVFVEELNAMLGDLGLNEVGGTWTIDVV